MEPRRTFEVLREGESRSVDSIAELPTGLSPWVGRAPGLATESPKAWDDEEDDLLDDDEDDEDEEFASDDDDEDDDLDDDEEDDDEDDKEDVEE